MCKSAISPVCQSIMPVSIIRIIYLYKLFELIIIFVVLFGASSSTKQSTKTNTLFSPLCYKDSSTFFALILPLFPIIRTKRVRHIATVRTTFLFHYEYLQLKNITQLQKTAVDAENFMNNMQFCGSYNSILTRKIEIVTSSI